MPTETRKSQPKKQNDPKDQRRPRQARQGTQQPKDLDSKHDNTRIAQVSEAADPVKTEKEEPGPEFYKNLKRETDEIIKITECDKYRKKEIKSNWTKYEIPLKSYDEVEEEDLGADFETLVQAAASVGGHFQFKHERSWEEDAKPTAYDKYFEIDFNELYTALSSIPFIERNNIEDISVFTETDILNMQQRADRFRKKILKDKSDPELQVQEKILSNLKDDINSSDASLDSKVIKNVELQPEIKLNKEISNNVCQELSSKSKQDQIPISSESYKDVLNISKSKEEDSSLDVDDLVDILKAETTLVLRPEAELNKEDVSVKINKDSNKEEKNIINESPEDLEKWLDDFLEG